jgi:hypothetical protein
LGVAEILISAAGACGGAVDFQALKASMVCSIGRVLIFVDGAFGTQKGIG